MGVIIQIINIYIMNVKNLKEMFERQATFKPEPPPPPRPIQKRSMPPSQVPQPSHTSTSETSVPQSGPCPLPPARPLPTSTQNFLQQLNQKLASNNRQPSITQAFYNHYKPKDECKQETVGKLDELQIQDIINGVPEVRSRKQTNIRYGINQKDSNQQAVRLSELEGEIDINAAQNSTFSELLAKMVQNLHLIKENSKNQQKSYTRKSKVVNKYDYQDAQQNPELKLKRIEFVMNIVFGQAQFELVAPQETQKKLDSKSKLLNRNSTPISMKQPWKGNTAKQPQGSVRVLPAHHGLQSTKDIHIAEIIQDKNKDDSLPERVQTFKRPSMVSNNFLNELSMKLKQKQQHDAQKSKQIEQDKSKTLLQGKTDNAPLTPRQIKKPKKKQSFHDC